jgi:glycosyltransferase involved in cell wall biosynthesis
MLEGISVVIPTNLQVEVYSAVSSVLAQTYQAIEIIVIDDSKDQSCDLPFFSNVRLLKTGGGMGPGYARNLGVAAAKGKWIAFLDDDDAWSTDKLEIQVTEALSGGLDAVLTGARIIQKSMSIRPKEFLERNVSPLSAIYGKPNLFRNKYYFPMSSLIVKKEIAVKFPFSETVYERENLLFLENIYLSGSQMVQIKKPLTVINYSSSKSLSRMNLREEKAWLNYLLEYKSSLVNNFLLESVRNFIRIRKFKDAREILKVRNSGNNILFRMISIALGFLVVFDNKKLLKNQ